MMEQIITSCLQFCFSFCVFLLLLFSFQNKLRKYNVCFDQVLSRSSHCLIKFCHPETGMFGVQNQVSNFKINPVIRPFLK
uniref:Uncharacterized protein n=1 Tax=Arundo donax TaxID=35708 RepID=A0A0A9HGC5_ARUDO